MRTRPLLLALTASLLFTPAASALSEFGIEGMGMVSTRADELRATISADGQRILWASNREGGAGGWDLWQATLQDKRWMDPQPLVLNSAADDVDPFFSADGRWLYFASNRKGGRGGFDLYRAPLAGNGDIGAPQPLGNAVNGRQDERSPSLADDGALLLASNRSAGVGGWDLWAAARDGDGFAAPAPLGGINTTADEVDGSWLGDGRAVVFARANAQGGTQLWVSQCRQGQWGEAAPLSLSFNTAESDTRGALIDANKPGELVVSGKARAPRAGGLDLYRMKAPTVDGSADCR
ncbi:TolB-like protein [Stenotrophomonas sp. Iso1]|uniref:TolB family protein n=1 Tax=Stenotrophomonas sp. Iso1 TaxID=2977283 RepID=UPI0022B78200|nr:TolB-like protein [Stenotrophomonas sp. Iso1]